MFNDQKDVLKRGLREDVREEKTVVVFTIDADPRAK